MNATLHARMVKGRPRVILAFEPGDITVSQIGGTIIETMWRMVGPVTMERGTPTSPARLVFETCSAKWAAMSQNGAVAVVIEFETSPPSTSDLALILAKAN